MKDMMMKKSLLIAFAAVMALGLSASTASALAIGDANYLGYVDPSVPANAAGEVQSINDLLARPAPSGPTTIAGVTYLRSSNTCGGPCPAATTVGADQGDPPAPTVFVTGWTYVLAKYGNTAHIWYVGNLTGNQTIPQTATPGGGLSHISRYNLTTTQVPDGGVTAGLLGLAMLGVGYLRRRIG
jgi:hypothetical protein